MYLGLEPGEQQGVFGSLVVALIPDDPRNDDAGVPCGSELVPQPESQDN